MTDYTLPHLKQPEAESIHIIREVAAEFDKPVMLYSIGKDSAVMLHLTRKAFYPGKPPFPLAYAVRPRRQSGNEDGALPYLGCYPLTGAVESTATTLPEIIQEMLLATTSERQGRVIDHDQAGSMEQKKREGYF